MTDDNKKPDRLSAVDARKFDPSSLVGTYFLGTAENGWQGAIVAEPSPGVYLCELFGWAVGESIEQRLVRLEDMAAWHFYDDAEWMRNAYEHGSIQREWDTARKEEKHDEPADS